MLKLENRENWIFERVYVETPVDTDGDGKADLIAVFIRRPRNITGVHAVYVANPYMMTCNEDWYDLHDVNQELKAYPEQNIEESSIRFDFSTDVVARAAAGETASIDAAEDMGFAEVREIRKTNGYAESSELTEMSLEEWDAMEFECISPLYEHLNMKGYASVFSAGLGTSTSEGFTISGSREEIAAFKSVIDWLNGRCRAFTNKTDNIEVKADWCSGNVAMSAKSYLGTMCMGVATTGVEGLKTIIPEAGICNWYEYYRHGGLVTPALDWQGDDVDLLAKYCFSRAKDADYPEIKDSYDKVHASMVAAEDRESGNYNLFWDERNYLNCMDKMKASALVIQGLNDWNVKASQAYAFLKGMEAHGIEHKILLHRGKHVYVYNLQDAPVLDIIERWLAHYLGGEDNGIEKEPQVLIQNNIDASEWQASESWPPEGDDGAEYIKFPVDDVSGEWVIVDSLADTAYDWETDNRQAWLDELVLSDDPEYKNRVKLEWNPEKETRVSGEVKVSFSAAIDKPTAILSAMLVEIGEDTRITGDEVVKADGSTILSIDETPSAYAVVTRASINAQNRKTLWSKTAIEPGEFYDYTINLNATDYTVREGHRLALVLYGIDAEQTLRPRAVTEIRIKKDSLVAEIPVC